MEYRRGLPASPKDHTMPDVSDQAVVQRLREILEIYHQPRMGWPGKCGNMRDEIENMIDDILGGQLVFAEPAGPGDAPEQPQEAPGRDPEHTDDGSHTGADEGLRGDPRPLEPAGPKQHRRR